MYKTIKINFLSNLSAQKVEKKAEQPAAIPKDETNQPKCWVSIKKTVLIVGAKGINIIPSKIFENWTKASVKSIMSSFLDI